MDQCIWIQLAQNLLNFKKVVHIFDMFDLCGAAQKCLEKPSWVQQVATCYQLSTRRWCYCSTLSPQTGLTGEETKNLLQTVAVSCSPPPPFSGLSGRSFSVGRIWVSKCQPSRTLVPWDELGGILKFLFHLGTKPQVLQVAKFQAYLFRWEFQEQLGLKERQCVHIDKDLYCNHTSALPTCRISFLLDRLMQSNKIIG